MKPTSCPDCGVVESASAVPAVSRRRFLHSTLTGAAALAASPLLEPALRAAPTMRSKSETLAAQLFKGLTPEQRAAVCFPFGHELQARVDNNWHITKPTLDKFFTADQQALTKEIFRNLHSPEYAETVYNQVTHDSGKAGFMGGSSVAFFGEPGSGKFEFVLTGRHCTRRCDGDSVAGTAFGGPIFYGHAAGSFNEQPDHPGNAYWYQAKRANEVFQALSGKQRELALLGDSREENGILTVKLKGKVKPIDGIPLTELSRDQKELVHKVMADLLAPFRKEDTDEVMKLVNQNGFDNLRMAFYKNQDIGKDGVWDVWQIEGPAMVWYFRGDPHVHVWVNVRENA
ncbi:MAG: DUF3500 domain-containing protein [Verrucomicrobia bacterium]|nr:DUF3500 domain-containing protein [Verrucomicrobiota bacterium]